MSLRGVLLGGIVAAGLGLSGAGVTAALMDVPQDAVPVQDPVGDALRNTAPVPQTPLAPATPPAAPVPAPVPVQENPSVTVEGAPQEELAEDLEEEATEEEATEVEAPAEVVETTVRRRLPIAVIHAVDKTTAERMRFEVEVGGRPVRFSKSLIFKVRACEVTGANEVTEDSIAYLEVGIQPRAAQASNEARQVFKGWMFASSPSLNGLEHPLYDAWVVGCKN